MDPSEQRTREAAAPLLEQELVAHKESMAGLRVIAVQHEVTRRDDEAAAKRKRERTAEAAILLLLGLFPGRRKQAHTAAVESAANELRRLHLQERSLWATLATSIGGQAAQATPALRAAASGYGRHLAAVAERELERRAVGSMSRSVMALEYRVERIAHAEVWSASVEEIGRVQRAAGIFDASLMREYSAVLDRRTCPTCRGMDGMRIQATERFDVEPPAHHFCRCMTFLTR